MVCKNVGGKSRESLFVELSLTMSISVPFATADETELTDTFIIVTFVSSNYRGKIKKYIQLLNLKKNEEEINNINFRKK